jgi:hypothetical protein
MQNEQDGLEDPILRNLLLTFTHLLWPMIAACALQVACGGVGDI